jgi:hypothetical protein
MGHGNLPFVTGDKMCFPDIYPADLYNKPFPAGRNLGF